jgi:hypothetical protein
LWFANQKKVSNFAIEKNKALFPPLQGVGKGLLTMKW